VGTLRRKEIKVKIHEIHGKIRGEIMILWPNPNLSPSVVFAHGMGFSSLLLMLPLLVLALALDSLFPTNPGTREMNLKNEEQNRTQSLLLPPSSSIEKRKLMNKS
jgi:hypothetical protein